MSTWLLGDKLIDCAAPQIMAIVNATPDSFYASSCLDAEVSLADQLSVLLSKKPDIIDIGGQSTRPGSVRASAQKEIANILPVIEELRKLDGHVPLTVDTYSAVVAEAALNAGANGVNDISAGRFDPRMLPLVAERCCGYILMHMLGTPESMQRDPHYENCLAEVRGFLEERLAAAVARRIAPERIVLDPGIGFGKRLEDNIKLLTGAATLAELGQPLLYGVSRKSYIGSISGEQDPARRLPGTLGATWALLDQGVMLHRVHDVLETRQLIDVWQGLSAARE
jgi:dihydropteroate synthase